MLLTEKVVLSPTPKQEQWLWQMSMAATELYNIALQQRRWHFYRHHGTAQSLSYTYQNSQLVELKKAFPCFNQLYSLVAQEVLRLVNKDYRSFWGRLKNQRLNGDEVTARPPWFKSALKYFTLPYIQSGFELDDEYLVVSGGMESYKTSKGKTKRRQYKERIKIEGYRNLPDNIHSLTISYEKGKYYANLVYEITPAKLGSERPLKVVAFDPGVKTFLTGATDSGCLIEVHSTVNRSTRYFDKEIDLVKSKLDRCKKGSRRWKRLKKALSTLYQRRAGQINGTLHATAKLLANSRHDIISVGSPNKLGMVSSDPAKGKGNQRINRAVQNNWPHKKFLGYLGYKTESRGKYTHKADERYSTQTCSNCGNRQKLKPTIRTYKCPKCTMVLGRDDNAAINLLNNLLTSFYRPKVNYRDYRKKKIYSRTLSGQWYVAYKKVG
ncbi:transposase [Desulfoscipio gibsoniae DSM 7213]|uniref:Transposase n=2 Tax=Desulfoscipio gibsoniae TaxID=102134 RepID=R4KSU3_9FIRM|nr:transposase [Desulfoscipio gibsoniae DSM 7213]